MYLAILQKNVPQISEWTVESIRMHCCSYQEVLEDLSSLLPGIDNVLPVALSQYVLRNRGKNKCLYSSAMLSLSLALTLSLFFLCFSLFLFKYLQIAGFSVLCSLITYHNPLQVPAYQIQHSSRFFFILLKKNNNYTLTHKIFFLTHLFFTLQIEA